MDFSLLSSHLTAQELIYLGFWYHTLLVFLLLLLGSLFFHLFFWLLLFFPISISEWTLVLLLNLPLFSSYTQSCGGEYPTHVGDSQIPISNPDFYSEPYTRTYLFISSLLVYWIATSKITLEHNSDFSTNVFLSQTSPSQHMDTPPICLQSNTSEAILDSSLSFNLPK